MQFEDAHQDIYSAVAKNTIDLKSVTDEIRQLQKPIEQNKLRYKEQMSINP